MWLTTLDVAKVLRVSTRWVRWLARMRELPCEETEGGQRLFRRADVERALLQRTFAAACSRPRQLMVLRVRMLKAGYEPRQMSLLPRRLQLVRGGGERSDPQAEVKGARSLGKRGESDTSGYVNRRAGGRR